MSIVKIQGLDPYRRVRRFRVSQHGLRMLFEEGATWRVREGIPPNARAIGVQVDWDTQGIVLFVEHESFLQIREADVIPEEGLIILERPDLT